MKVVVLAAGRSKRLKPIEDKNFLQFLGKPLLEHQLEQLLKIGLKDIVVVAGAHNMKNTQQLAKKMGGIFKVVEQKDLNDGMAGAVLAAEKLVKNGSMLIVSANDVVDGAIYQELLPALKQSDVDGFIVGKKMKDYFPGGYLKTNRKGLIEAIVEKPRPGTEPSKFVNLVIHYYQDSKKLYDALHQVKSKKDDRYEVALDHLIKAGLRLKMLPYNGNWLPIKYPWHILNVMDFFLERACDPKKLKAMNIEIADTAVIKGQVFLEEGVKIFDNAIVIGPAYIGKNTVIAMNAMVRASHIGAHCVIGSSSEITRSYVGDKVWTHTNYIGDSIIGDNCAFGAGTVTGNLRLDERTIKVTIKDEKLDSQRIKLGLITGENVRCGINTSFMPGVKIGNNCFIGAGIVIAEDIEDNMFVYGKTTLTKKKNSSVPNANGREALKKKLV